METSLEWSQRPFDVAVVIYLGVIVLLFVIRPDFIFQNPHIYHKFGLQGEDTEKTMIPLWLLFLVLGIIIYYSVIIFLKN